jgi:hypothetical protein
MRSVVASVASIGLAILAAGCSPYLEERLISKGIGTELSAEDIAESSRRLETYLNYLCHQAGMGRLEQDGETPRFVCEMNRYGGAAWTLLVKAGFNDIDRRCDSYLAWLNSRRRNRTAVLSQLTDSRNFTEALLFTTGAGATPLTIVGLAFGLASNTFTNYYSRLIVEIERSTVEVLVREKRLDYRARLNTQIAFQPDAIHVLREYLLICTPHYIENLINQRARDSVTNNLPADTRHPDQIRRSIVADALIRAIPQSPRGPLPGTGNDQPLPREQKMAGLTQTERGIPQPIGRTIQVNLCIMSPADSFNSARDAIQQAKEGIARSNPSLFRSVFMKAGNTINSSAEAQIFLNASAPCVFGTSDVGYRTAFEKFGFPDVASVTQLQQVLKVCDDTLAVSGRFDAATRAAIKVAKGKISQTRRAGLSDLTSDTLRSTSFAAIEQTCR